MIQSWATTLGRVVKQETELEKGGEVVPLYLSSFKNPGVDIYELMV